MDVSATNTGERIYSVLILFFGLVALSSVIGSVSASITAIRNMSGEQQKQLWVLRQYLKQRKVNKALVTKITRYLEHRHSVKKSLLVPGKVTLLGVISEQLSNQLSKAINSPVLEVHPFFAVLSVHFSEFVVIYRDKANSLSALKNKEYATDDVVFFEGEEAVGMYFIKLGKFMYSGVKTPLMKPCYASEASLWTEWRHRGTLMGAADMNEVLIIVPGEFGKIMGYHPKPWHFAKRYGEDFLKRLNAMEPAVLRDSEVVVSEQCIKREHNSLNDAPPTVEATQPSTEEASERRDIDI